MAVRAVQVEHLKELVTLQRFYARQGFIGQMPANLDTLRAVRDRFRWLGGSDADLLREAVDVYRKLHKAFAPDPAMERKLARERGVHNVPKLLAALRETQQPESSAAGRPAAEREGGTRDQ